MTPYVNPNGPEFWLVKDGTPWPKVRHEAAIWARELGGDAAAYEGIKTDARISDETEWVHGDDDGCADSQFGGDEPPEGWVPCCRTVVAYEFRAVER